MNYLPSKELLGEVLDTTITELAFKNNYVEYTSSISGNPYCYITYDKINIYELAHKCKEWAYRQGYVLLSGYSAYGVGLFFCSCKGWVSENYDKKIEITHNTEPEAIFKACQWILDNKD